MNKNHLLLACCLLSGLNVKAQIDPYSVDPNPPTQISGYELVWSDEFNDTGKPNSQNWNYEYGFVRNNEDQWYQESNANCRDGALQIEGRKERFLNPNYNPNSSDWRQKRQYVDYTSASINTMNLQSWQYGRFEIRAKIPAVDGSWPAIWTLGNNYEWPSSGEIDIMEYYDNSILANAAWGTSTRWVAQWDSSKKPMSYFLNKDAEWANKYHVWRMDWDSENIHLYLDDELLNTIELSKTINPTGINPFRQPHYILLNLALGGDNGGNPENPDYPVTYYVDYVRVYQKIPASNNESQSKDVYSVINDHLIFNTDYTNNVDVKIFDCQGRMLVNRTLSNSDKFIPVKTFRKGLYFLHFNSKTHSDVSKIVIK